MRDNLNLEEIDIKLEEISKKIKSLAYRENYMETSLTEDKIKELQRYIRMPGLIQKKIYSTREERIDELEKKAVNLPKNNNHSLQEQANHFIKIMSEDLPPEECLVVLEKWLEDLMKKIKKKEAFKE